MSMAFIISWGRSMKKFRFLTTLFASFISLSSLAGCTNPPTQAEIDAFLPPVSSIQKEGLNIESITFINIPAAGIPVGSFDSFDIKLKIVYSDASEEYYPLQMDNLPDSLKILFNTVGEHTVTIAFRGEEITYTFKIIEGVDHFLIRYFSYDGTLLLEEEVAPAGKMVGPVPSVPTRSADSLYTYTTLGWDKTIEPGVTLITRNMDIYPLYRKTQKRYDVTKQTVPTFDGGKMRVMSSNYDSYYHFCDAYIYAGRINRVPLLASPETPKATTSISGNLFFDTSKTKAEHKESLVQNIYNEALNVSTANYDDYFTDLSNTTPVGYGVGDSINFEYINSNVLFEGDSSYSEVNKDSLSSFIDLYDGSDINHWYSYDIRQSLDLMTGNEYYRCAIEGSVDVVIRAQYYYLSSSEKKVQFMYYTYYFLVNNINTFPVTEYAIDDNFSRSGNQISFNMADLSSLLINIAEAH